MGISNNNVIDEMVSLLTVDLYPHILYNQTIPK